MSKKKTFFEKVLCDVDGQPSSKRLVTLVAFVLISAAFITNLIIEVPLKRYMFEGMLWLTGAGIGSATVEKFSRRGFKDSSEDSE